MIGLPLRLLAREVYDRVSMEVGEQSVALITGEERKLPRHPRYFVCTTEAMPIDREVDFVAVDEIQLAQHPDRGHVFTDRMLHLRGKRETWLMGAETMRNRIQELVPTATVQVRPRLSRLTHSGRISIKALPPRSAVVAFSTAQVIELADRIQRIHGGTAVVLGALSPRTRNAQVAMYQAGEVHHMVATDAIGMGLNMNVDLVAFAGIRKFDGRKERVLDVSELAQIAGRAGRFMNDGSFATLAPLPAFSQNIAYALENHVFPPASRLGWRNHDLDFSNVDSLLASLRQRPRHPALQPVDGAEDHEALIQLASRPEIRRVAIGPQKVRLLWDVCQIPDYRQLLQESHWRLLSDIFLQLAGPRALVDSDWLARQVAHVDNTQGDIDTLMLRLAFIRTWTYVSNHDAWVDEPRAWQQHTRQIEDRLSDALHERLIQRFVTQKRPRLYSPATPRARSSPNNEDEHPNKKKGPFQTLAAWKARLATATQVAAPSHGIDDVLESDFESFQVDALGQILLDGLCVGRLSRGIDLNRPDVAVVAEDSLRAGPKLQIQRRLQAFARSWAQQVIAPLQGPCLESLTPAGRGLLHLLSARLGTVAMSVAREQVALLPPSDRNTLKNMGIVLGSRFVFSRPMLDPQIVPRRVLLCRIFLSFPGVGIFPDGHSTYCSLQPGVDPSAYTAMGYPVLGDRGIRVDMVDRVLGVLRNHRESDRFDVPERIVAWLGLEPGADIQALKLAFSIAPSKRNADANVRKPKPRTKSKPYK